MGGTLVVSRAVNLHGYYKHELEARGFRNVCFTAVDKDGLNLMINEVKPSLLVVSSFFYQGGTPYMLGGLRERFHELNIAAVSLHDYPLSLAPWLIYHGVNSYLNLWEGDEEFFSGLQVVRDGRQYRSPLVKDIIERFPDWPDVKNKTTKRMHQCLILLCCGLETESIGNEMHLSTRSVYHLLDFLYGTFHVGSREEMVALAWELDLVTKQDIRFYDKKKNREKLPGWAKKQININRGIYDFKNKKQ